MEEAQINCIVYPGMFSDELAVELGGSVFFVPSSNVIVDGDPDKDGIQGRLKVQVMEYEKKWWIVVPSDNRPELPIEHSELITA